MTVNRGTEALATQGTQAVELAQRERDQALELLEEADTYLREIRAENLDGSEPALGELLDRITSLWQSLPRENR